MFVPQPINTILSEAFCYGNITIYGFDINKDSKTYSFLVSEFKKSDNSRNIQTYWNLVRNVKHLETMTKEYIDFVDQIFYVLDERFGPRIDICFDSPFAIKLYIINELLHSITAKVMVTAHDRSINSVSDYFSYTFVDIIDCLKKFNVITFYKIPSNDAWVPTWKLEWVCEDTSTLEGEKSTDIDIEIDTILSNPKLCYFDYYSDVQIVKRIAMRLKYLKEKAPEYFKFIEGIGILAEFSKWAFNNYPYNQLADGYLDLVQVSSEIYLPDGVNRDIDKIDLIFELIPPNLATYILGFSSLTGSLSTKLIREYVKESKNDDYFRGIEEKNKRYIDSHMFHRNKVGNLNEDGKNLNLLYHPVDEYNVDDISLLFCNDFYFIFTYPEFDNLNRKSINPYNRRPIDNRYINILRDKVVSKSIILDDICERGLSLTLNGTMKENYDEIMENIHKYTTPPPRRTYIPEDMMALFFPELNG